MHFCFELGSGFVLHNYSLDFRRLCMSVSVFIGQVNKARACKKA